MKVLFAKTCFLLLLLIIFTLGKSSAQHDINYAGDGMLKVNVGSLLFKTISLRYEHAINDAMSIDVSLSVAPKSKLTFASSLDNLFEQANNLKVGKLVLAPETRFYLKGHVLNGLYVAPFVKMGSYALDLDYNYTTSGGKQYIFLTGNLITVTAGVSVGGQWHIGNGFYLDCALFGPEYGFSSGKLIGTKSLTAQDRTDLKADLDNLDLPLIKLESTVNNIGTSIKLKGPWAGIRSNIGIGYKF